MRTLAKIFRIAFYDVVRVVKDKLAVLWLLLMPLGFIYIFGTTMNFNRTSNTWLPIIDLDDSDLSALLIDELREDTFNVDIRPATDEINVQYWSRAIIIPATFSEDVLRGERVDVIFTKGQGNTEYTLHAQSHLVKTITRFVGALAAVNAIGNELTLPQMDRIKTELNKPARLTLSQGQHPSVRPPPSGFSFSLPAYIIFFVLMMSIMYGGISLIDDRKFGQLNRILASPLSPMEIFAGKVLGRTFIPMIQSIFIILVGILLFGIHLGESPHVLLLVILCYSLCCASIGLVFGLICTTENQVSSVGVLISILFAALGGCWWPLEIVPGSVKTIAMMTPTYWGLQGMHDVISFGKSYQSVFPECGILLVYSSIFLGISIYLFRRYGN